MATNAHGDARPSLPELQDAVRQIPGIATAIIRWPDPLGPASLRVEFQTDADHEAVGQAVIRTLVEVGQVDLATMQLDHEQPPARSTRPVFTSLVLDRLGSDLSVEVGLQVGGKEVTGVARLSDRATDADQLTAVARATVEALLHVVGTQPYAIRHVTQVQVGGTDVVSVLVDLPHDDAPRGPLVGTALVARDAREAAVRATLDAVNRHIDVGQRAATLDWGPQPPM